MPRTKVMCILVCSEAFQPIHLFSTLATYAQLVTKINDEKTQQLLPKAQFWQERACAKYQWLSWLILCHYCDTPLPWLSQLT